MKAVTYIDAERNFRTLSFAKIIEYGCTREVRNDSIALYRERLLSPFTGLLEDKVRVYNDRASVVDWTTECGRCVCVLLL